ncbi:uncharacterized protein LOC135383258 isoform X1 [Ornithodoros turicata]|uniref:uncharacterized protein LOC135383258 isoform X1 n=1 Tax=Ornithodoros turicata TaxID=34597 RepID=UPI003138A2B0
MKLEHNHRDLLKCYVFIAMLFVICAFIATALTMGWWKGLIAYVLLFASTMLVGSVVVAGSVKRHTSHERLMTVRDQGDRHVEVPVGVDNRGFENHSPGYSPSLGFGLSSTYRDLSNQTQYKIMPRSCISSPSVRGVINGYWTENDDNYGSGFQHELKDKTGKSKSDTCLHGFGGLSSCAESPVCDNFCSIPQDKTKGAIVSYQRRRNVNCAYQRDEFLKNNPMIKLIRPSPLRRSRTISLWPTCSQGQSFNQTNRFFLTASPEQTERTSAQEGAKRSTVEEHLDTARQEQPQIKFTDYGFNVALSDTLSTLSSTSDVKNERGLFPTANESPMSSSSLVPSFWKTEASSPVDTPHPGNRVTPPPGLSNMNSVSPSSCSPSGYKPSYLLEAFLSSSWHSNEPESEDENKMQTSTKEFLPEHVLENEHIFTTTSSSCKGDLTEVISVVCNGERERESDGRATFASFSVTSSGVKGTR